MNPPRPFASASSARGGGGARQDPTPQHRARDRLLHPRQQHRLHGDALRVGQGSARVHQAPLAVIGKFIRTIFPELLEGLKALHAHGLLHLDVKPANIYLRPGGHPMLLDFGAAQAAMTEKKRSLQSHPGPRAARTARPGPPGSMERSLRPRRLDMGVHERQARRRLRRRVEKDTLKPAVSTSHRHYSKPLLEIVDTCLGGWTKSSNARSADDVCGVPDVARQSDADSFINRLFWRKRAS